jgi:hypothetical protein
MKCKGVLLSALTVIVLGASGQIREGSISGTIVDEAGKPQPHVQVRCQKLNEFARDAGNRLVLRSPGFIKSVVAAEDGTFAIPDLPPGRYHLCAVGGRPTQLGSCEWGGVPVTHLAAGQDVKNLFRTIRDGALLTVRVRDPNGRIALPDSSGMAPPERRFNLELVSPTGSQRRAGRIESSQSEHIFQLVVPRRWPMRLFLDTAVRITNESGIALESRRPSTLTVSPGENDHLTVILLVP